MMKKEDTKQFTADVYNAIKRRNKAKFLAIVTPEIEKTQNGVNLPAFIEAENAYKAFEEIGAFDEYGRLLRPE